MKISFNWLKEYVAFAWTPPQLAERLTMLGIEVERLQTLGGDFPKVVVAQILASDKHPNADRLSVCRVADGTSERQIVCGAKNYKVGDKVPLALPGATLPNGLTIKVGKLRGVESHGMLCSAAELKLAENAEGLFILPPDARVGAPLSEVLGAGDTIFDLEITPNRPDLLSYIGIAREIGVLTGNPLQIPEVRGEAIYRASNKTDGDKSPHHEIADPIENFASVQVEAPDLCPRYTARVIRGVKIGPSPAWLKAKLERVGARSINNVVDITNFVLYEIGQPLHAFDLAQVEGRKLVIRRARAGETIVTLENTELTLDPEKLVIADAAKPACLAGIIGGQNSGIHDKTTDILLESAYFNPPNIRAASKKLGVRSESSYRFERGADIGICDWASQRAAALIAESAGGTVCTGVIDTNPNPQLPAPIPCRYSRINSRLGIEVPHETTKKILIGLGLSVTNETAEACAVQPPTFRVDLQTEADLSEEIGRIHGIEKIPALAAPARPAWSEADARYDQLAKIRSRLTGMGFWETITPILISGKGEPLARPNSESVRLKNPLSEEMAVLRSSLLGGLLNSLRVNVSRGNPDLRLFEIGRVFRMQDGQPVETSTVGLAITGRRMSPFWSGENRDAKADFYDLKGVLETLGAQTDCIHQVPPPHAREYDLRDPLFVAEFDLEPLVAAKRTIRFAELPKFPSIARDIAMIVSEATTHAQIISAIQEAKPQWLEATEVFDIFRGEAIGAGKKSVAYRLTYRASDRTLTDTEVNRAHDQVKSALKKSIRCELRE